MSPLQTLLTQGGEVGYEETKVAYEGTEVAYEGTEVACEVIKETFK